MGTGIDPEIADAILSHQLDLLRLEAGVRARVVRLLYQLQKELEGMVNKPGLSAYNKAQLRSLLMQANETIDGYYARMQGELQLSLTGVAQAQAEHVGGILAVSTARSLPTETFLSRLVSNALIAGAPSSDWWERQSAAAAFRFANAVRHGAAMGETNEQIVARVAGSAGKPGIMEASRVEARALVHSSIQTIANASRMETFRQNRSVVKGVRQLSTFDSHTTVTCIAYDGASWDLDGNPLGDTTLPFVNDGGSLDGVPRHWGCRSVLVPITKTYKELGIDAPEPGAGLRARSGGAKSMDEWLARRTKEQLDEQLGPGRAELYLAGKLTREQLLNLSGSPLTVGQLVKKYGEAA